MRNAHVRGTAYLDDALASPTGRGCAAQCSTIAARAGTTTPARSPRRRARWTVQRGLLLLTCVATAAHATDALTVEQALARARAHNPDLLAARQELAIARGGVVTARRLSPFNPEVAGEGARRSLGSAGAGTDFGIAVSQELEVAGQRGRRIAGARANAERVEQLVRNRERLLEAAVKRAFFAVLAQRQRRQLLQRVAEFSRRLRDASAARVREGESPVMESNLAEIRYGQARKDALVAERDHGTALLELKRLLDLPPDASLEVAGDLRPGSRTVVRSALIDQARANRPDLAAGRKEVARVDAETALTRRLIVPNPTLEGFYREEAGVDGTEHIAGGAIRIPLPLFDRRQGELMALAGRRGQAQLEVDATVRSIEQEVAVAAQTYESARCEVELFEEDVLGRADENLRFIETAYRAGKIDFFQFIVVQNDLVAAQLSYLESVASFRDAEIGLEEAVGAPLGAGGVR